MNLGRCEHLDGSSRVKLGAYYTPSDLVQEVHRLIGPHLRLGRKAVIADTAAGYGAFLSELGGEVRASDIDGAACRQLKKLLPAGSVFHGNSLVGVSRERLNIPENAKLITIGNPPYNDVTSEFRSGRKGKNDADSDLKDRDLGISFLRSYDKLRADVVCVLHPLSYLIKPANFARLRSFRENYRLERGVLFSSARFSQTGNAKFPIAAALYARGEGMNYDHIRNFSFDVLGERGVFRLSDFITTDGLINKYPPRSRDNKRSDIGLYYYTFRDINSLKRNCGFMGEAHPNGIVVNLNDFHKYAYLYAFKKFFNPPNAWLFGNLSPIVSPRLLEKETNNLVSFALSDNPTLSRLNSSVGKKIARYYGASLPDKVEAERLHKKLEWGMRDPVGLSCPG